MNELPQIIKKEIKEKGPINFQRFMQLALYHPEFGYYSSGKAKIGKDGDFYTSPSVHSSFGEVISNLIVKSFEFLDTDTFTILEFGAGKGYLAFDILNSLKKNHGNIYNNIQYKIVEVGNDSIKFSKNLLKHHSNKTKWVNEIHEIKENSLSGVVLSNEFVDAFPFHRLKFLNGEIKETHVNLENYKFVEQYFDIKENELIQYVNSYCNDLAEGQEIEINLMLRDWLKNINKILAKGFVLTIDYGFLADELYSSRRMNGTYKCFYKHNLSSNPYENIGYQDITSDVNFSDLIQFGKSLGLKKIKYTNQGQFLIDWGIINILENYNESRHQNDRMAIKNLIMPEFMGSKFKFLIQAKNMDSKSTKIFYKEGDLRLIRKTL